jgi:CheY-like chemotaxis protein
MEGKKILIVDDEFSDLSTMKTILEKEGYEVVAVTNGAKAFDSLKGDGFSLILIDIKMPTLSGYDLLRLMREKINHKCPLMYVSIVPKSDVDMTDADGFIQKPFSPKNFINSVNKILNDFKKR